MKGFNLFLSVIIAIFDSIATMQREQRRLDLQEQKARNEKAREALIVQNTLTAEARTAKVWNDVTLGDLKIERERRDLGLDTPPFEPKDYPPS